MNGIILWAGHLEGNDRLTEKKTEMHLLSIIYYDS